VSGPHWGYPAEQPLSHRAYPVETGNLNVRTGPDGVMPCSYRVLSVARRVLAVARL
jgi:hypothetical protein